MAERAAEDHRFYQLGCMQRTYQYDLHHKGRHQHKGNLNFSAYAQGNDNQYLGVVGKNYYAKPWGNDSSGVQAVVNGPSYWKRIYHRPNVAEMFRKQDLEAAAAAEAQAKLWEDDVPVGGLRTSASEPCIGSKQPAKEEEIVDGYDKIKESMRSFVERGGKPRIRNIEAGERLNFHNTLPHKYNMKAGGKNIRWGHDQMAHRSSKSEVNWIMSTYFRSDTPAILAGVGTQPLFSEAEMQRAKGQRR
mmetsp:Transcript_31855/g.74461  ORF Transcript_31855/g.74461 Transcript_31855/m.74461 type:complete len:246 (-) Transcript_31855:164-901(-)|eukprot:CAMPEP_0178423128 /NCGR_PEP_ID=MMETSP0689_2-20121128/27530_1 /TAXON_ID=160604 /ORGANISM="Amphidinium massartii, Strain CS-259" /LENGTH=245 /DNA_ID=CAMNT_0020044715 /DNA_START=67 /DNA_END=804 /DNA_ORIENTATION=-